MAEDKEQDLSMEDILSSIKNILSEDEQGKEVPAATPQRKFWNCLLQCALPMTMPIPA